MLEQRTYTHARCKTETEVGGPEFKAMSDPLAGMQSTYCSHCEDQFPVDEFAWSDTGERISDYYARHNRNATAADLWWCGNGGLAALALAGLLIGAGLGVLIGMVSTLTVGVIMGILLAVAGAVTGIVARESFVTKSITRRVCGVDDTRALR